MFTGKDLDDTGLYYFAARYYDPSVGRFITEDPHWNASGLSHRADRENSGSIAAMTQATNLYVYCGNNPLILVDPSGKVFTLATGLVGAVAGGIAGAIYSLRANDGRGVSWRHVAAGAAIGGAIGLTGGAAAAKLTTGYALASTSVVTVGAKVAISAIGAPSYATFDAFKRAYGSAGEGMNWHHIVGQHAGNISEFGAERIHHLGNMVRVESGKLGLLHNEISRYYSMPDRALLTGDLTVRAWLTKQD